MENINEKFLAINEGLEKFNIKNCKADLKLAKMEADFIIKMAKLQYADYIEKNGFWELKGKIQALKESIKESAAKITEKENFLKPFKTEAGKQI